MTGEIATAGSAQPLKPTLTFSNIVFSDGTSIDLHDDQIVVFVGPNNAGKSAALREISSAVGKLNNSKVIKSVTRSRFGDDNDLRAFLELNSVKQTSGVGYHFSGINYSINADYIHYFMTDGSQEFVAPFFRSSIPTETRITGSNAAGPLAVHQAPPTHPIHLLLLDPKLAAEMCDLFMRAFGEELIVLRAGGSAFPLYVGKRPMLSAGEDELSKSFVDQLVANAVPLEHQGDGMRSFVTVMLNVLASDHHSIQFLDEPEAFLHPPQARLLGEYIANNRKSNSQLFVATHSPEILYGILTSTTTKVRIVRIQRSGKVNKVKELSKSKTEAISKDTLTRYSGLLSGIFHKHVVIAESDSDCMFYSSLLNSKSVSGDNEPDVLFVHGSGKHRLAKMVDTLRDLDVPVSVIVDIDVLNDEGTFKGLFLAAGGVWDDVSSAFRSLKVAIEEVRPPLNASQVKAMIEVQLENVTGVGAFPKATEKAIKGVFKTLSPWDDVKRAGRSGLRPGGATRHYDAIAEACSRVGIWLVPVGELEGFCQSIEAGHGPAFVEKVLVDRDIDTDEELEAARKFMTKIWQSMPEAQMRRSRIEL